MTDMYGVRHPGRREAAVAVVVACLLILVSWVAGRFGDDPKPELSSLASSPEDSVVEVDLPEQVTAEQAAACAKGGQVLYSTVQRTATGSSPVLVMRSEDGDLRLCDSFGADSPSVAPVEIADADNPARLLSNGRQDWDCDGKRLAGVTLSHWLSVSDPVASVDIRFLVDGVNGPWFRAEARDGFVHAHAWLSQQNTGVQVQVQTRVLDDAGEPVAQDALPTAAQPLTGCAGSGVQLG